VNILPKNFIFSPVGEKNVKKFPHIVSLSEVENFSKLHFFGKILPRLDFFGGKIL